MHVEKKKSWFSYSRLFAVLPLFLLVILYFAVRLVVNDQMSSNSDQAAEHLKSQVHSVINESSLMYDSIMDNGNVTNILGEDADNSSKLNICRLLKSNVESSLYVSHIYIFNLRSGKIISDRGSFSESSKDYLLSTFGCTEDNLHNIPEDGSFNLLNSKQLTPYCIYPIYKGGEQIASMVVCLNMTEFIRMFYDIDAEVCAIYNSSAFISSYGGVISNKFDWSDVNAVNKLVGTSVYCKYITDDSLTYMVAQEKAVYDRPLTFIATIFIVYIAVVIVSWIIFQISDSKRTRARYAHLASMIPDSYVGDSSLEQIYENIQTSLLDYNTQKMQLASAKKEKELYRLLTTDESAGIESYSNTGVDTDCPAHLICCFYIQHERNTERTHQNFELQLVIVRTTFFELFKQSGISFAVCEGDRSFIAIINVHDSLTDRNTVISMCENVINLVNNNYQIIAKLIISSVIQNVSDLQSSYKEINDVNHFTNAINSRVTCIKMDEYNGPSDMLLNSDYIRQEQILINTILTRKYDIIPDMANSILTNYVLPFQSNYTVGQQRFISIRNILAEGVKSASFDVRAEEKMNQIYQVSSVQELNSLTRDIYLNLSGNENGESSRTKVKEYIDSNISDPNLSIAMISEAVNINLSRLVRTFQSEMGMNIADYISYKRIEIAKKLLRETDMTVSQISDRVGYNNADTFTRNFRKQRNMTPTEYRKYHQK